MKLGVVPLVDGEVTSRHELDAAKDAIRKQAGPRRYQLESSIRGSASPG